MRRAELEEREIDRLVELAHCADLEHALGDALRVQ